MVSPNHEFASYKLYHHYFSKEINIPNIRYTNPLFSLKSIPAFILPYSFALSVTPGEGCIINYTRNRHTIYWFVKVQKNGEVAIIIGEGNEAICQRDNSIMRQYDNETIRQYDNLKGRGGFAAPKTSNLS